MKTFSLIIAAVAMIGFIGCEDLPFDPFGGGGNGGGEAAGRLGASA